MKRIIGLFLLSLFSAALTLLGYTQFVVKQDTGLDSHPTLSTPNAIHRDLSALELDFTSAAQSTVNAVVHVKNLSYLQPKSSSILEYFYGYKAAPEQQIGTGSGVIITQDGYIVTNNHVIANASALEVTLNDNTTYKARLIGTDLQTDIALLKIDTQQELPYLVFGDSDQIALGQWVLAVGNPFNLTSTVTAGIISAKARNLSKTGIQSFIQTDAAINPGNSGGALVNTNGELIGINTMISSNTGSYVGYAFAVPSNITRKIVEDLLEYGNVQQGNLGVRGFELNELLAKDLHLNHTKGFYVKEVVQSDTPNPLQAHDIIVAINDKTINTFVDIKSILNTKRPKDTVRLSILRDDQPMEIDIALSAVVQQEFTYKQITFTDYQDSQNENLTAVIITRVDNPQYKAYENQLLQAVVLGVDNQTISSLDQLKQYLNAINQDYKIDLRLLTKSSKRIAITL